MTERVRVVVIGAGQAGLSVSHELTHADIEHVVLERNRVADSWRKRWESFCLVIPNWTLRLPGNVYDGDDPHGFMPRDEISTYLEGYANSFRAPVREGVRVSSVESTSRGLSLRTSEGDLLANAVVVASGAYQKPHRPAAAASLPTDVLAIDAESYTKPDDLPEGRVLVVGSGQTGCQIAEELHETGRDVVLSCGRAPWAPRRIAGKDLVEWIVATPFLDHTLDDLPDPQARLTANFQTTGRGGGHDLHYRTLRRDGVTLAGHLVGVEDGAVVFADDLRDSVSFGDDRYRDITTLITKSCIGRGETPPKFPSPEPFEGNGLGRMDLAGCGAVIFTSGFRPDFTSWIRFPDAFDSLGFPIQKEGQSEVVPGLYFMGTHFLRKRKSATFLGVAEDAAVVADKVSIKV